MPPRRITPTDQPADVSRETDVEAPLLSASDEAAAVAEARRQFRERQVKAARAAVIKAEIDRLEREARLQTTDGRMLEMVTFTLDLPEGSDEYGGRTIVDGKMHYNGEEITCTRAEAASYLEMMWRGQLHEQSLHGQSRTEFYRRQKPVAVTAHGAAHVEATTPIMVA